MENPDERAVRTFRQAAWLNFGGYFCVVLSLVVPLLTDGQEEVTLFLSLMFAGLALQVPFHIELHRQ